MSSTEQQAITGGAKRRDSGAITKAPPPDDDRLPGPIAAMLVRTDTGVSASPANRVAARFRRTRKASAR